MNTTPLIIARRIGLGGKGSGRRSATGIVVAVTGIALAIVVMLVSIAVMNGFKDEIRRKVTGFESQLTIELPPPASDMSAERGSTSLTPQPIALSPAIHEAISQLAGYGYDAEAWLAASRPVILKTPDNFKGLVAKASDSSRGMEFLGQHVHRGSMPDFMADSTANSIVVSSISAKQLGLDVGDRVQGFFFGDNGVKVRNLTVSAVYDTRFSDYDKVFVYTSMTLLRGIDRLSDNQGTRVELGGLDDADVDAAADILQSSLLERLYTGQDTVVYQVDNVHRRGAHYFNWLDLLDTNVDVILVLMALVAGFTLVSSLFIIILERVAMIGILKSLGASNGFIRRIFIIIAERIVVRGMIIGNALALALIWLQSTFRIIPLDPDTYYLSHVPMLITPANILWLNFGVLVISVAVLILPSQIVAKISPARSIRFE